MEHAARTSAGPQSRRPAAEGVARPSSAQAFADLRPQAAAQRALTQSVQTGPAMTAQRQALQSAFGGAAQQRRADPPARRSGAGLPDGLKAGVEALSGVSMDGVAVHYNSSQPAQLNALAYAQGRDIHLAPGQERHLPHEAWHIVQQAQGRVRPTMQLKGGVAINDDAGLEREADVMGARALQATGEVQAATQLSGRDASASAAQLVLQLATINIRPAHQLKLPGTISGITFGSRPSSNSIKQAQHITAFLAFEAMIESNIVDKNLTGAATALKALTPHIRGLISPNTSKHYLLDGLDALDAVLDEALAFAAGNDNGSAKGRIEWSIDEILKIRNQIPGTALNTTNTGGHGEASAHNLLTEVEKVIRETGGLKPDWAPNTVAGEAGVAMWKLMDARPVKGHDPAEFTPRLVKHIEQMRLSYPKVFAWLSTNPAWYLRARLASGEKGLPVEQFSPQQIAEVQQLLEAEGW